MINKFGLKKEIINKININNQVISITFVGSFLSKKKYSDIDVVVIIKNFDELIFKKINKNLKTINPRKYGIQKKLLVNNTFGPLKYDYENNLVIHLMIYSKKDHINHVINSPFTCYDWQRYNSSFGLNLKNIYRVYGLSCDDFIGNYRGIDNYIYSLKNHFIYYKKYSFKKNQPIFIQKKIILKSKKQIDEFIYHIIFHISRNVLKFLSNTNKDFFKRDILNLFQVLFSKKEYQQLRNLFLQLESSKYGNKLKKQIVNSEELAIFFLGKIKNFLYLISKYNKKITFKRHFKTKFSNKIFLGNKLDVGIKKKNYQINHKFDLAFSSNLKRAKQTALLFSKNLKINKYLNEIDYGNVEGLNYEKLKFRYPKIINDWTNGKDPKFPRGENIALVYKRVQKFLKLLKSVSRNKENKNKILIVSHNVFLRTLMSFFFKIERRDTYKINIKYGEELNFLFYKNKIIPNIKNKNLNRIFKKLHESSINT